MVKNAFYRLFNQFLDQIFPPESVVSFDSLMKSLRVLQISGEKLETPRLSGLTKDFDGKS
jgi:hypothetical protein